MKTIIRTILFIGTICCLKPIVPAASFDNPDIIRNIIPCLSSLQDAYYFCTANKEFYENYWINDAFWAEDTVHHDYFHEKLQEQSKTDRLTRILLFVLDKDISRLVENISVTFVETAQRQFNRKSKSDEVIFNCSLHPQELLNILIKISHADKTYGRKITGQSNQSIYVGHVLWANWLAEGACYSVTLSINAKMSKINTREFQIGFFMTLLEYSRTGLNDRFRKDWILRLAKMAALHPEAALMYASLAFEDCYFFWTTISTDTEYLNRFYHMGVASSYQSTDYKKFFEIIKGYFESALNTERSIPGALDRYNCACLKNCGTYIQGIVINPLNDSK